MSERSAIVWDGAATTFDRAADHGLREPDVRAAWAGLLDRLLPSPPSRVADLGCGTGSLAILAADLGHVVDGIDFSEGMLEIARAKIGGRVGITVALGDAARPALAERSYDAVMCRHVLWALRDPASALSTWSRLLRPGGRLVLIEGRWATGGGLAHQEVVSLMTAQGFGATVEQLDDPRYWGSPIADERYAVVARTLRSSSDR